MEPMNEKRAKEVVEEYKRQMQALIPPPIEEFVPTMEYWKAYGYLSGLEQGRREAVEIVKKELSDAQSFNAHYAVAAHNDTLQALERLLPKESQ